MNYYTLRHSGPTLVFSITEESTLAEIKQKCCAIWLIRENTYNFYDDSFNNLCLSENISVNEIAKNYKPLDTTLNDGQIVFYLIEKMKSQYFLFNSQISSIDPKATNLNSQVNENNFGDVEDPVLLDTIEMIKSGKVLKGIENYKTNNVSENNIYLRSIKRIDNWWINIILVLIYIVSYNDCYLLFLFLLLF